MRCDEDEESICQHENCNLDRKKAAGEKTNYKRAHSMCGSEMKKETKKWKMIK